METKDNKNNKDKVTIPDDSKEPVKNLGNTVALITDALYKNALIPLPNKYAYIEQLDEDYFSQLEFNPEDGTMKTKNNSLEPIRIQDLITRRIYKDLDLPLLRTLYTIIYRNPCKIDTNTVTVPLPTLAAHLGINVRGEGDRAKAYDFMKKLTAFTNVIGVLNNGSFYQLLVFLGYNKNDNTITFGSPYMNRVLIDLQKSNTVQKKGDTYIKPHHNFLIKSTIGNERNKYAVEIVTVITRLIQQRGIAPKEKKEISLAEIEAAAERGAQKAVQKEFSDNPVDTNKDDKPQTKPHITTVHKSFQGIIDEIPQLKEALNKPTIDKKTGEAKEKTAREKNTILENAFTKAYSLLKEKTDVYKYYINLKIPNIIPTSSTLDIALSITHEGINKDYKNPV